MTPLIYVHLSITFNGHSLLVTIIVQPMQSPAFLQGLLVVLFEEKSGVIEAGGTEIPTADANEWRDQRVIELEQELQNTKQYLQATIEELESSNEEIKSTNEELQSANEELETSQEESQSVNEELVTLNAELQDKVEQLTWVNSDINNILASIDIGIIFLDRHMHIRRFNQAATEVINLIETDVGRPIGHLVTKMAQDDWIKTARKVFETLAPQEIEVQTDSGQWFSLRVRPYRTTENAIEGVVLTFARLSEQGQVARRIEADYAFVKTMINSIKYPLLVLDANLRVILANSAFHHLFQVNLDETGGQLIYELGNGQWDIPRLRELLEEIIPQNQVIEDFEVAHKFPAIGLKKMRLDARRVKAIHNQPPFILLTIEDLTPTD